MPVQKILNILKILFIALSAMFIFLYISLLQRQANAVAEVSARGVRDSASVLNNIPLSPIMALIPLIVCAVFTVILFVMSAQEKKKELKSATTDIHTVADPQTAQAASVNKTQNNTAASINETQSQPAASEMQNKPASAPADEPTVLSNEEPAAEISVSGPAVNDTEEKSSEEENEESPN